jgi:hypothetical protein
MGREHRQRGLDSPPRASSNSSLLITLIPPVTGRNQQCILGLRSDRELHCENRFDRGPLHLTQLAGLAFEFIGHRARMRPISWPPVSSPHPSIRDRVSFGLLYRGCFLHRFDLSSPAASSVGPQLGQ